VFWQEDIVSLNDIFDLKNISGVLFNPKLFQISSLSKDSNNLLQILKPQYCPITYIKSVVK
jgi:hypothetical protein